MNRNLWTASLVALGLTVSYTASAEPTFYGLLRSRDLSPFGSLRLDMRPAHGIAIKPGTWVVETEIGYQNTWALSPEVETYLTQLEPQGRRDLSPQDVQAIQDLPGENYLLDVESGLLDVTLHYKFTQNWTGYVIASAVTYTGGFLDGLIEDFHDNFGFSSFGRPATSKNDVNLIFDLKSGQVAMFDSPVSSGFLDPTIGVRYVGIELPDPWRLALEAAVKIPVSGSRLLLSTGRTDYGVQGYLQRRGRHHALYANLSAVYYAGTRFPVEQESQVLPTLILGYERVLTERTNVNLQAYISPSVYTHDETDLDDLLSDKYQLSIGLRHRRGGFLFSFGATENLQNLNNTPDIGFQAGVVYFPERALARAPSTP